MATSLCYVYKNAVYNQTNNCVLVNAQHMFHIKCLKEVHVADFTGCVSLHNLKNQKAQCSVSQTFLLTGPFWLKNTTTDPHILAHVWMTGIQIKNLYLKTDFRQILKPTNSIYKNALHDVILIKMTVAHFMVAGSFLIRFSKGHMK